MLKDRRKVVVVLPAYNAAKTLERTVKEIDRTIVDEVILVDDFSGDATLEVARRLDLVIVKHKNNRGYGANQKTCYRTALKRGAEIVVMLHPDYQYDPKLIKHFVALIEEDYFDLMLGSRIRSRREALAGGMPIYKYYANRVLTLLENLATGHNLSEWHTGMRAYRREVLENLQFKNYSDDFFFDSQMLFNIVARKYRIGEISVPVVYFSEASSINFSRSLKYGLQTLFLAFRFWFFGLK